MPEEEIQTQEPERPEYKSQTITSEAADILKMLLERTDMEKREFILRLNGWIEETEINQQTGEIEVKWKYDEKSAISTPAGRQRIMLALNAAFSSDKIITNIDRNDVANLTINIGEEMIKQLELNAKDYGISNADWSLLSLVIVQKQYLSLKAAEGEGLRKLIKTIYQIKQHEQFIQQKTSETKGRGLFGFMKRG